MKKKCLELHRVIPQIQRLPPFPTNTPHVLHIETTWKRPFPRRFKVEYTWCACRANIFISNIYLLAKEASLCNNAGDNTQYSYLKNF